MLGQRRLAEADHALQFADRPFGSHKLSQNHQPMRVRHCFQQATRAPSAHVRRFNIHGGSSESSSPRLPTSSLGRWPGPSALIGRSFAYQSNQDSNRPPSQKRSRMQRQSGREEFPAQRRLRHTGRRSVTRSLASLPGNLRSARPGQSACHSPFACELRRPAAETFMRTARYRPSNQLGGRPGV